MLPLGVALIATLTFVVAFGLLGIVPTALAALERAGSGTAAMFDRTLCDDEKEKQVQAAGLAMLGTAAQLTLRLAGCVTLAAMPVVLADLGGLVPATLTIDLILRWEFLLGITLALAAGAWLWSRRQGVRTTGNYSTSDQNLHKLVFAGPGLQLAAAGLEDRFLSHTWRDVPETPPVFIASLPRAGTTVLLNAFNDLPRVATHLYRDMPLVMAPVLWAKFSRLFARSGGLTERAHGDGLKVGFDSPEAFEEIIWRAFYPDKYHEDGISLWERKDLHAEAQTFLSTHFRKIITLRTGGIGRYVSKNNANIARLDLLPVMFPGCTIIVPIRSPAEHAASLWRQHRNFTAQHAADPFVKRYMRDIGHLEFGDLHSPIRFAGVTPHDLTPDMPDYWLTYVIAAYKHIDMRPEGLHLLSQEQILAAPSQTIEALCALTGIPHDGVDISEHFQPIADRADRQAFSSSTLEEADRLYASLCARQIAI